MTLEVTPEIEEMVQKLLRSGNYSGTNQIFHEALALLSKRDRLRADIQKGLAELDSGEGIDGEEVFRSLDGKAERLPGADS
jgi:antitoxin ParD1/3/4